MRETRKYFGTTTTTTTTYPNTVSYVACFLSLWKRIARRHDEGIRGVDVSSWNHSLAICLRLSSFF
jgi:hypothetical protein